MALEAGIVAALVLSMIVAAISLGNRLDRSLYAQGDAAEEALLAGAAAHDVLDALTDAESGERGFLLTARSDYLEPYVQSEGRIARALASLDRLTATAAVQPADVALLRRLASEEKAELDRTIGIARRDGIDAARAEVLTDQGKATMDAARSLVARMVARSGLEREGRIREIRARESASGSLVTAVVIVAAVLLGAIAAVLMLSRSRLVQAQRALRVQTGRLTGTVAQLPEGIAVFDANGRLLLSNQQLFNLSGLPVSLATRGTPWDSFKSSAGWVTPLLDGPAPPDGASAEIVTDQRTLSLTRCQMPDGGQLLAVSDITRRVQAEAIARQTSKMEAIGQLTGGIAHDFNNLLQVISTNLELIDARAAPDAWLNARLTAAMGGVERAAQLTRQLLAFARRQPLAPETIDAGALVASMEDMLRRTLGEPVELEMVMGEGLWPVRADRHQLESSLLNLAINARDAMPNGGRLTIELVNVVLDEGYAVENPEAQPGPYVMLAVTDSGIGMSSEQLVRALEPFYTTKPEGRGTGLGLPMVYGFVRQSGGYFRLTSEPGVGTTARLYLPRSASSPWVRTSTQPDAPALPIDRARPGALILVVEDDPVVRSAAVQALHGLGYRTVEAASAAEALATLRDGATPDLLFSDVIMPGPVTARELSAEAKRLLPSLAVVFTSGYTETSIVHNGRLDPGVVLVSKPWQIADLARRLRLALEAAQSGTGVRGGSLRILLVEDDALVRETTAEVLTDLGHMVFQAGTAAEALALADAEPDVVVTDIGLPDMDGLLLAERLREIRPALRLVIASGETHEVREGEVWLEKPFSEQRLRQALDDAMSAAPSR